MKKFEQFQDMVARLYPEYNKDTVDGRTNMSTMEVTFQVTEACSLCCTYCYQINKTPKVMDFEVAKTFIDNLFAGKYAGYVSVEEKPFIVLDFIGGEPFLQPKLIEQICDYFVDKAIELCHPWAEHFVISLCSNGVAYFEPDVQHLLNKYKNKISLSITIDGNKELHDSCRVFADGRGSYDLAVAAAKDWMNHGGYMGSKITIAPGNIKYMNDAIVHMIELGYTEINANAVYEKGWNIEHARLFYKKLKEIGQYFIDNNLIETHFLSLFQEDVFGKPKPIDDLQTWCGGNGNAMLAIDPDGNLYPCLRYMPSSLGTDREPFIIGNVWDGIGKTEKYAQMIKCISCINRRTETTDECFYCPISEGCSECSAYNYQMNGTPNSHCTYICDMYKARVLANCYYWNSWYKKINSSKRFKLWVPDEWALEIIDKDELEMLKELAGQKGEVNPPYPRPLDLIEWKKELDDLPQDYEENELRQKFKDYLKIKENGKPFDYKQLAEK